jgi:hypothetical protein
VTRSGHFNPVFKEALHADQRVLQGIASRGGVCDKNCVKIMSAIADVWQAQTCAEATTHYLAACLDRYSASHLVLSLFDDTLSGGKTTLIVTINNIDAGF